jgi:hypothetical protein
MRALDRRQQSRRPIELDSISQVCGAIEKVQHARNIIQIGPI